ncbi:MAG: hypothetical protein V4596_05205 [Bdellovibrionota bacterium]
MKKILLVILGISWMLAQTALAQEVVSFKEWKKAKTLESQTVIAQLETLEKGSPAQFGPEAQSKLKQARTNLEITKDLNAQDYFVLYLSPRFQNDQQAYTKAVQMMSADEIAQILMGYDRVIEERRKKNLLPLDSAKFGFNTPKKMEPSQVLSLIDK